MFSSDRICRRLLVLLLCSVGARTLSASQGVPASPQKEEGAQLFTPEPLLVRGDASYRRRQEGRAGGEASPRMISDAIESYKAAAQLHPDGAEARWKLARALYFKATYTGQDAAARRAYLEEARQASEEALAILKDRARAQGFGDFPRLSPRQKAQALSRDSDAAPTYFWAAVAWGEWALAVGKLKAARMGAAERIRDYASTVVALDPGFEEAGGYRILGRLHHQAPRLPFLTGWVSRKEALRNLRLAVKVAPHNFVNRHFLSEALAEGGASERAEAIRIAHGLLADAPSPAHLVEELKIQQDAKKNLKIWTTGRD